MPTDTPPKTWQLAEADESLTSALAVAAGVSGVVARILVSRGVADPESARRFLEPDLARDWRDPSTVTGMDHAADAVVGAVTAGRAIAVLGDFDADGLTAAALMARGLAAMGARVTVSVPHRFDDGYGLCDTVVARLLEERPDLVVTVDCGISSAAEVIRLRQAGIDVVVTDHHEPAGDVPVGIPVADPKLPGSPFEGLAGAGVALKLVQAVGQRLGFPDTWLSLTDIAAVGTVADVVPLLDENRALVAHGIESIRRSPRVCLAALGHAAGLQPAEIGADRIAFALAPRLNAAGRMGDPASALELLMCDDPVRADQLARELDELNRARQDCEGVLFEAAAAQAKATHHPGDRLLLLAGEGWHEGVKGIVASRLVGMYGVPTLMFCIEDGVALGSGRSAGNVDLHAAVASAGAMLTRFGGHAAAVGVTLPANDLEAFGAALRGHLAGLPAEDFVPRVTIDAESALGDLGPELAVELDALQPFGHGNPRPLLASRSVFMNGRKRVGKDGAHLRFEAYDGLASLPAIAFRRPDAASLETHEAAVDLAYHLEVDEWQGRRRLQLLVREVARHPEGESRAAELVEELFADAERIIARADYEGVEDAESFHTKLAGVSFEGRQDVLARLEPGGLLRVERQPANAHDSNAIALHDPVGDQVGFFNRRLAAALAPVIDRGVPYEVTVTEITGGGDKALGVNVLVARRDAAGNVPDAAERLERRTTLAALEPPALDAALLEALLGGRPLHEAQARSLELLAAGRSCLTVMATGRGKSLIFHLHAARTALAHGQASLFVYPLRALVADQAYHLQERFALLGLGVALITGETSPTARDDLFAALADGSLDVLLTTPEFLDRHAARFAECGRVRFVVVDEAHHVGLARAGHRPAYTRLGAALEVLGGPTVLACTATAGDEIADGIRATLGIAETVLDPTVRENLRIDDRRGMSDKPTFLASIAAKGEKVIIYVNSREQSVRIAQRLRDASPRLRQRTAFYNGGMARAARGAVERAFREGDITAIVATSAFGEGVNIPDVRHVALFHLPFHRVEFNQMCGRCGRDGSPAEVHLLFGDKDARLNELILDGTAPGLDDLRALYAVLRDHQESADGPMFEVTNAELAEAVRKRRKGSRLSESGVSAGIGVFRELGFVTGEGAGGYRRLCLLPAPEGKADLTTSVRYAEGLEEIEEFAAFRDWALRAPAADLLSAFDRPILPTTGS